MIPRRRLGSWTGWGVVVVVAMIAGCGPTTFSDSNPLVITGTPPAPEPKRVEVTEDRIEIHEKIQFDFDKATIKPASHDLLNEIAQVIKDNPHIHEISIEGHTSSEGSDKYNQDLSERRAASVREYLTEHGIPEDKLTSKGWGESKPIADNETASGKEKNRRVEFVITDQAEIKKTVEIDPDTGERHVVSKEVAGESKFEEVSK